MEIILNKKNMCVCVKNSYNAKFVINNTIKKRFIINAKIILLNVNSVIKNFKKMMK